MNLLERVLAAGLARALLVFDNTVFCFSWLGLSRQSRLLKSAATGDVVAAPVDVDEDDDEHELVVIILHLFFR